MITEMDSRYVEICKGHLVCVEDKCLRCHISSDNKKASCYRPVFFNREYFGTKDRKALERNKESSLTGEDHSQEGEGRDASESNPTPSRNPAMPDIIDYYSCGQEEA